jgi:hypothetical protein
MKKISDLLRNDIENLKKKQMEYDLENDLLSSHYCKARLGWLTDQYEIEAEIEREAERIMRAA